MSIENIINEAWEKKDQITPGSDENLKNTVNQIIDDLDSGKVRVAEKINGVSGQLINILKKQSC